MSAFVVSKAHIDALVQAGLAPAYPGDKLGWYREGERDPMRYLTHENADQVGAMLWAENVASVEHRYSPPGREEIYGEGFESPPDFELPGSYVAVPIAPGVEPVEMPEWVGGYVFPLGRVRTPAPVAVLKAIGCYEYQSCEHDGWKASEAKTFCDALRDHAISKLPGYEEASWTI